MAVAARLRALLDGLRQGVAVAQHRTTFVLLLNNVLGAATGFAFWLLFARWAGLSPSTMGVGYAAVALGIAIGVVAKGGLDTALIQKVPGTSRRHGARLLASAVAASAITCLALTAALAAVAAAVGFFPALSWSAWILVAALAILLSASWMQDAYFVALGVARYSLDRNLALAAGRLLLPLPIVALAFVHPVPLSWALALLASVAVGVLRSWRLPERDGHDAPVRAFLVGSLRNVTGGAAEFLPGLVLVPLVLAFDGPAAAAYFGMAWTAAALLFQVSAAIGRSAFAELVRGDPDELRPAIRRGVGEHLLVVIPAAVLLALFAPELLSVFGARYAAEGAGALAILCASIPFVAATSLYLAVLRARGTAWAQVVFPLGMLTGLGVLAPLLDMRYGLAGVAVAWLLSSVPFGLFAAWRLSRLMRASTPFAPGAPIGRAQDAD